MMTPEFKKQIILIAIISLLIGGLAGLSGGLLAGGLLDQYILPWLKQGGGESLLTRFNLNERVIRLPEESSAIEAVQKVQSSVVSIVITKDLSKYYSGASQLFPFDDFFGFNLPFGQSQPWPEGEQEIGGGTGFIVSADGLILTNKHVVADTEAEYSVIANDGQRYDAKVLAVDPVNDLAVIKVEASNLQSVVLGDSSTLQVGQTVIAIGNTLSTYHNTVTKGIISAINRQVTAGGNYGFTETIEEAIQTDAAINPGNSGGPLVNLDGEVVGINTAVSGSGQSIGFAIPINQAKKAIESVKKSGKIVRPMLGIRYVLLDAEIAQNNKLSVGYGALILRGREITDLAVVPGSPADKAGLKENDIVLAIDGQKIDANHSLARLIVQYNPGDTVTLKILRQGEEKEVKVVLTEWEAGGNSGN